MQAPAPSPADQSLLADSLAACPETLLADWLDDHPSALSLAMLQYLKDRRVTVSHILEDPQHTDQLTRAALEIAHRIAPTDPNAQALAQWMRGLWAMYNDAAAAVTCFRAALSVYAAVGDCMSVARLNSNLVGVLATVGRHEEAEACYHAARPVFAAIVEQEPHYLLYLEQNFGWLLHTWGRYEQALDVHRQALDLAVRHNLEISIAEIQVNLCLTLAQLGRFDELEWMLQQDRAVALQVGELMTVARIDMNLGELYTMLGRPVEALHRFQRAAAGLTTMERGSVLAREAVLLRELGALPAALRQFEAALQSFADYDLKPSSAETLVNLATTLRRLGGRKRLKRAYDVLHNAQVLWAEMGNTVQAVQVIYEQIEVALDQADYDRALSLLADAAALPQSSWGAAQFRLLRAEVHRRAGLAPAAALDAAADYQATLAFAEDQGLVPLRRRALFGLGKLTLPVDWDSARNYLEAAALLDDRMRQTLTLQELKASFHEQASDLFDDLIRYACRRGDHTLALSYAWRAKASAFLELAWSMADESAYTSEQRRALEQLRQQIAARRWALAKVAETTPCDGYEAADEELAALTEQLLTVRRSAQQKHANIATLAAVDVGAALAAMEEDLLLEYVRCGTDIYGICTSKEGACRAIRLCDEDTIAELSGKVALAFHSIHRLAPELRGAALANDGGACLPLLKRCHDLLVSPFADRLQALETGGKVLVAPCDALALLPFAAFWTGEHFWVSEVQIELAQCGAILLLPSARAVEYSPSVVIGATAGGADGVRAEAEAVSEALAPNALFLDLPALTYLDSLTAPPRALHIAAHTIHRGDAPFFSGLQLQGEVLSIEHCYDLPLWGTELVTLSGCSTAGGLESDAAIFAFQSACLLAGAQRVLCSLWPIADGMARPLMVHFYALLKAGMTVPAAVRQTQLHFLSQPESCHPALWAAFTSVRR